MYTNQLVYYMFMYVKMHVHLPMFCRVCTLTHVPFFTLCTYTCRVCTLTHVFWFTSCTVLVYADLCTLTHVSYFTVCTSLGRCLGRCMYTNSCLLVNFMYMYIVYVEVCTLTHVICFTLCTSMCRCMHTNPCFLLYFVYVYVLMYVHLPMFPANYLLYTYL